MSFEFATAGRVIFGEGRASELGEIARGYGDRAIVVRGKGERARPWITLLAEHGIGVAELQVVAEPDVALVEQGVRQARRESCDVVIAIGGGSVIDTGKAIAAMLTNPGEIREYLEVIGEGKPLTAAPAPFVAVPTTAGTGSEVSRNSVLAVPEARVKVSLRSPLMLADVAVVDPELTYGLPPAITASTGMDALTQCIEPYVTPQANPLTDGIAREGLQRAAGSLHRAYSDGSDRRARRDMAIASLCGGLALANAKLGAVHGIAGPLGGMFPVPHGVACARLLPPVIGANVRALRSRSPDSPALDRYDEVARLVTGREHARAEDAAAWARELVENLNVPRLGSFGVDPSAVAEIAAKAEQASSMRGNPVPLTRDEIEAVIVAAL